MMLCIYALCCVLRMPNTMPSRRVHAVFCGVLAALAAVPFVYARFLTFYEAMFAALLFLHHLRVCKSIFKLRYGRF